MTHTPSIARHVRHLFLLLLVTSTAHAQGPVRVVVGQRTVEVRVEGSTLLVGDARIPFPLGRAPTRPPTTESIALPGMRLTLLRYREGDAIVEVLVGPSGVLHTGRADLHGDPGERTRQALSIVREHGVSIRREDEDERVRLCDGSRLVRARVFDPHTSRFVPLPRTDEPVGDALTLTPAESLERPLAPLARWVGSDFEPSASAPEGTRELAFALDGRPATMLTMTAPASMARPTVLGRWEGGATYPLRALGFVPRPTGATAPPPAFIRVSIDARSFVVRFPADAAPGARYVVRLPEPVAARCIALEIGPPTTGETSTLGDVSFFASFDLEGGLDRLVSDLAAGGEAGTLAADVLSRAGEPAMTLLASRLEGMPAGERRLALRVVARLAERSEVARTMLARALGDADETVQRMALEATRPLGDQGIALLEAHVRSGGSGATSELTRRAPGRALVALLARLAASDAEARAALRPMIVEAARRARAEEVAAAFDSLGEAPADVRADIGLVAAELPASQAVARTIAESLLAEDADFTTRRKILLITRALPAADRGEALIAFAVRSLDAEEWMIRADAIAIAGDANRPDAKAHRTRLLEDPYPRVRVAAIEAGPLDDALVVAVARLARLDDWPIVRAAGVAAIAGDARTRPIQRAAVRDRAERVRVVAIDVLIANRDVGAYEQIEGRLSAPGERAEVYRAALRYVRTLCVHQAVSVVADLLDRMAADESTIELAQEAALVLVALGTDDARDALGRAPGTVRGPLDAPNATRPALCVPLDAP